VAGASLLISQLDIAMQIGQDGLWPWNPVQILWRALTNLQNALHHGDL
jgi:hypothetical protein